METPWASALPCFQVCLPGLQIAFEHQSHDGLTAFAELA